MTAKERIIASITGGEIDHLAWSPNLAYWWENSSEEVIAMGEVAFLKSIGAEALIRGHYPYKPGKTSWEHVFLFDISYDGGCSEKNILEGDKKYLIYETPIGNLTFMYQYAKSADTWYLQEHGVKEEEDFKILTYLKDHTVLTPNYERFLKEEAEIGEDGLLVPLISPDLKSGFQSMVEFWVGTEEIAYAVYDYPEVVEEALNAMKRVNMEAVKICAESKAEFFLTWEDSSTTNISPTFYKTYIVPEINDWCEVLHKAGKYYIQHACGQLEKLIPIMAKTKIDCIESISPPPTGNIEIVDARKALPERIALIGGIEGVHFLSTGLEELEVYVENLCNCVENSRYILANSDSCPPHVELEKFYMIGKLAKKRRQHYDK